MEEVLVIKLREIANLLSANSINILECLERMRMVHLVFTSAYYSPFF